jgi:hypothetical protein
MISVCMEKRGPTLTQTSLAVPMVSSVPIHTDTCTEYLLSEKILQIHRRATATSLSSSRITSTTRVISEMSRRDCAARAVALPLDSLRSRDSAVSSCAAGTGLTAASATRSPCIFRRVKRTASATPCAAVADIAPSTPTAQST